MVDVCKSTASFIFLKAAFDEVPPT